MRTAEREACGGGARATGPYESANVDTDANIRNPGRPLRLGCSSMVVVDLRGQSSVARQGGVSTLSKRERRGF